MGMLDGMKYVNIRHELPQIGIHQQQAMAERNTFRPAEMHRDYEPPLADVAASLVVVDISCYESRKAFGMLNTTDFAKKYGDEGRQHIKQHTSELTRAGWNAAKNAAKPGADYNGQVARSKFFGQVVKWPQWTLIHPADPQFTVHPSEIKGNVKPGHDKYDIKATADADIAIQTGSAENYMAKEGSIRMWATEGYIDIYA